MIMNKLQQLFSAYGQSPWLDNLNRPHLHDGTLTRMVTAGIRGVTANPTILAKAIQGSRDYDEQFHTLVGEGRPVLDAYWELVTTDIKQASSVLRPVFNDSRGSDGFVSVEVAPELAHDTEGTIAAARSLHERIDRPNLMVKIPATSAGIPAIETMIGEGRNINVTLIFSLTRYRQVIDAYLAGLERLAVSGGDVGAVRSVASFFISRVDTEVDGRLELTAAARALRGRVAVAQAKLAYQLFRQRFADERWSRLATLGAHVQRPLWASTSSKNAAQPDTLYVDSLIGRNTVTTMTESTLAAFQDHGHLADTLDVGVAAATETIRRLAGEGIGLDDVGETLERQGIAAFHDSFQHVLAALEAKAHRPAAA
jgi:transaldolase